MKIKTGDPADVAAHLGRKAFDTVIAAWHLSDRSAVAQRRRLADAVHDALGSARHTRLVYEAADRAYAQFLQDIKKIEAEI